jgi:predicted ATP-grasp superfamily ATP-dependent carboligase
MKPLPILHDRSIGTTKIATVALLGAFGPPILTAARSLRDAGIKVVVLSTAYGTPSAWSNAISVAECIRPEHLGTSSGLAVINDFIRRTGAQALLPFWDTQMLWLAANEGSLPRGCKLLSSSRQALEMLLSKDDQLLVAERCGFNLLPTWKLSQQEDVGTLDPAVYPVCLRPSVPLEVNPTFKVGVMRSPAELRAFLALRTWGPDPLLVQPFLPLPTVVIHGVRSEAGEMIALEAFIASTKFEGVTLELRPFPMDAKLALCCRKFAEEARITGPFHFELLYSADTGVFYYLEINVRLGGTTDKVFRLGFDEPLLTLAAYGFDVEVRPYQAQAGRAAVNRRAVLKHMYSVAKGHLSPLDYPVGGKLRHFGLSLRSLLWTADSIASRRDLTGTWFFYVAQRPPGEASRRPEPNWVMRLLHHH